MLNSIIDSTKVRLYDIKYIPFSSSYLIAWVYFNAKAILIFFDNKLEVLETIKKDYNKFKTQLNNDYNEKKPTDYFDTKILESTNNLQEQSAEYKKDLSDMVMQSNNQTKKKYTSLISSLFKEDKQIIKLFFENDKEVKDTFKDNNTLQKLNMQKATTEKILRSLISKDILKEESMYVQLTDIGLEMANDLFKENTNA
jgi:hypothetical protein